MKDTLLLVSILMLGLLTLPAASAVEGPIERCDPRGGQDGLLVGTATCATLWGGGATGDACRAVFGNSSCEAKTTPAY